MSVCSAASSERSAPRKVRLSGDQLDKLSRDELLKQFLKQEAYLEHVEKKLKKEKEDALSKKEELKKADPAPTTPKEFEDRLKQHQLEATRRENVLVMRLTAKEQEMSELMSQMEELRTGTATGSLRSTLLDPAVNLMFQRMNLEIKTTKDKLEQSQQELNAWKFTPDSNTGKRLMAKCRQLIAENEELGKEISSGKFAKLEGELSLSKALCEEQKKGQSEIDDLMVEMDEEMEGLQATIYFLQSQLKTLKAENVQLKETLAQTGKTSPDQPSNPAVVVAEAAAPLPPEVVEQKENPFADIDGFPLEDEPMQVDAKPSVQSIDSESGLKPPAPLLSPRTPPPSEEERLAPPPAAVKMEVDRTDRHRRHEVVKEDHHVTKKEELHHVITKEPRLSAKDEPITRKDHHLSTARSEEKDRLRASPEATKRSPKRPAESSTSRTTSSSLAVTTSSSSHRTSGHVTSSSSRDGSRSNDHKPRNSTPQARQQSERQERNYEKSKSPAPTRQERNLEKSKTEQSERPERNLEKSPPPQARQSMRQERNYEKSSKSPPPMKQTERQERNYEKSPAKSGGGSARGGTEVERELPPLGRQEEERRAKSSRQGAGATKIVESSKYAAPKEDVKPARSTAFTYENIEDSFESSNGDVEPYDPLAPAITEAGLVGETLKSLRRNSGETPSVGMATVAMATQSSYTPSSNLINNSIGSSLHSSRKRAKLIDYNSEEGSSPSSLGEEVSSANNGRIPGLSPAPRTRQGAGTTTAALPNQQQSQASRSSKLSSSRQSSQQQQNGGEGKLVYGTAAMPPKVSSRQQASAEEKAVYGTAAMPPKASRQQTGGGEEKEKSVLGMAATTVSAREDRKSGFESAVAMPTRTNVASDLGSSASRTTATPATSSRISGRKAGHVTTSTAASSKAANSGKIMLGVHKISPALIEACASAAVAPPPAASDKADSTDEIEILEEVEKGPLPRKYSADRLQPEQVVPRKSKAAPSMAFTGFQIHDRKQLVSQRHQQQQQPPAPILKLLPQQQGATSSLTTKSTKPDRHNMFAANGVEESGSDDD